MTKKSIVAKINKDKKLILELWNECKSYYDKAKQSEANRSAYVALMRQCSTSIVDHAMKGYADKQMEYEIAHAFTEFWDFFTWWLRDVNITPSVWNEMENYYHKIRIANTPPPQSSNLNNSFEVN